MDRILVMIASSILLLVLIIPFAFANPMPVLNWMDAQAGGSPEPNPKNTNITFFKEIVKADIGDYRVKVHADYWFRNERNQTETIKILLPLSKDPRGIDLKVEDIKTGWYRTLDFIEGDTEIFGYQSIAFEMSLTNFDEVKVTVEFWDDLYRYDNTEHDHINYYFAYLVGSARAWNRNLEIASFEFRIPVSIYDSGKFDGWDRTMNGTDYVFTKEYTDWLPDPGHDFEKLMWEKNKTLQSQSIPGNSNLIIGTIIVGVVISSIVLLIITFMSMIRFIYRKVRKTKIAP